MKKSRREILKMSAMAGAGMMLPAAAPAQRQNPATTTPPFHGHIIHRLGVQAQSPVITPFVDTLPIPPVIRPLPNSTTTITMKAFTQKLHRDMPPAHWVSWHGGPGHRRR